MSARRGTTVLEAVVAMPLVLLVGALAVQLFVAQLRVAGRQESRLAVSRELEHAALALAADVRPLAARDLESWSDSGLVMLAPVLVGYVCGTPAADVIDVVAGARGEAPRAILFAEPRAGDRLAWSMPDTSVQGLAPRLLDEAALDAELMTVERSAAGCVGSPLRGSTAPWRLRLATAAALLPDEAGAVRLRRRTEWRLYRAGDGAHYLGRRDWNGAAWSTIQPVAGPLHAFGDGGLRVRVLRADGTPASALAGDAHLVELTLRAPRVGPTGAPMSDSLFARLALRGGR